MVVVVVAGVEEAAEAEAVVEDAAVSRPETGRSLVLRLRLFIRKKKSFHQVNIKVSEHAHTQKKKKK